MSTDALADVLADASVASDSLPLPYDVMMVTCLWVMLSTVALETLGTEPLMKELQLISN